MQVKSNSPEAVEAHIPQYSGWISVAPSGRYFQDETGRGFLAIGQNDAITWPGLVELLEGGDPTVAEAYIRDLRANGITISRVMMEYAQFDEGLLENPVGTFVPNVVSFWDTFIALCEKHGLYLILTPFDTFWQVCNWDRHPYNAANGGPCVTMHDWLTAPAVLAAHQARWQFVIERWGRSPAIMAWDVMNEIDLYWNATPDEIAAYVSTMAGFIKQEELKHFGRTHLISVSSAAPTPDLRLGEVIYNHPLIDFANTHLYVGPGISTPVDAIEAAEEMADGVRLSLQSLRQTRPYFDSESGPIYEWITDPLLDKEYHHNMSWAHLCAGGAGSGLRWPYTRPHQLLPEMRLTLRGLARFASTIDWTTFASRNMTAAIRVSQPGVIKTGCADYAEMALVWLAVDTRLSRPASLGGMQVTLSRVLPAGEYTVEVWQTYTGQIVDVFNVDLAKQDSDAPTATPKVMTFTLPDVCAELRDVALVIKQKE